MQAQQVLQHKNTRQQAKARGFSNSLTSSNGHPLKPMAWSFVVGLAVGFVLTRKKSETTTHEMDKVTSTLKTGVAAIALAKTLRDLTDNTASKSRGNVHKQQRSPTRSQDTAVHS